MSSEKIGRINNELASPASQSTPEPKKMVVGRVNNESDKNAGLETAMHEEEIGVVNNEKKPDLDDQKA
jgi:hypothetical protein